jgi:hypothetical protein
MAESLGFKLEEPSNACGKVMDFDQRVRGANVPYAYDTESSSRSAHLAQHWVARKSNGGWSAGARYCGVVLKALWKEAINGVYSLDWVQSRVFSKQTDAWIRCLANNALS